MRDYQHMSRGTVEPHNVVSAIRGNARAEKYLTLAGVNGANERETLDDLPSVRGERRRRNKIRSLVTNLRQAMALNSCAVCMRGSDSARAVICTLPSVPSTAICDPPLRS